MRRSIVSMSVTSRSGRSSATTMPGKPAPDPTSATLPRAGKKGTTAAELTMCRVHRRGSSRGPTRPRSSPSSASICAKCSAAEKETPKISRISAVGSSTWARCSSLMVRPAPKRSRRPRPRQRRPRPPRRRAGPRRSGAARRPQTRRPVLRRRRRRGTPCARRGSSAQD